MNKVFYVAYLAAASIVLPFLFFSIQLFKYIHANSPPGYEHLPQINDLRLVLLYAICLALVQKTVLYFSTRVFKAIVKD